ncbi:MAG: DUF456 family protein [Gemmatimonadaceae bacterium]
MDTLLLAAVLLLSLFLIPFGLPGTWLMLAAAVGFNALTGSDRIGVVSLVVVGVLAFVGELLEFSLAGRYTRKYGGSRRASWGAILGGIVGAFVGVPVPLVGSMIGAFVGSFVGALVAEYTRSASAGTATRVATGALLGRVVAAAMKVGVGFVMAVWLVFAALG